MIFPKAKISNPDVTALYSSHNHPHQLQKEEEKDNGKPGDVVAIKGEPIVFTCMNSKSAYLLSNFSSCLRLSMVEGVSNLGKCPILLSLAPQIHSRRVHPLLSL